MTPEHPSDKQSLIDYLQARLPELAPIHNLATKGRIFVGGDPGEVVVQITDQSITVFVFAIVWERPYLPVMHPEHFAGFDWRPLPVESTKQKLDELIESARQVRLSRYRTCERCGETKPPEHMHGDEMCQSCAEKHLGVVY